MKELMDIKKGWAWFVSKCKSNIGIIILLCASFTFGYAFAYRQITDDCRFMGSFRDGPYSFTCQVRVR